MADITVRDVDARRDDGSLLVDVREAEEVAQGTVPGAVHIPLGELAERLGELDRARPVIAICRSGNRSGTARDVLEAAGFTADNMAGGMLAWTDAGLPVERR